MAKDLDEIKRRLPHLAAGEIAELKRALNALTSLGPAPTTGRGGQHGWDDEILDAIVATLQGHHGVVLSKQRLRLMAGHTTLTENLIAISEWIEKHAVSHAQRRGLITVGIDRLYLYLLNHGRPCGANDLMRAAHRFPEILALDFPGYADSGLIGLIIRERPLP